ncbi:MAG TPA: hypothetical protein VE398_21235 [Acidobacteriota bacterium]|nr:hypothetical protein [Acidobacteriota bacterium]
MRYRSDCSVGRRARADYRIFECCGDNDQLSYEALMTVMTVPRREEILKTHVLPVEPRLIRLRQWWAADIRESEGELELGFFNRTIVYKLRLELD